MVYTVTFNPSLDYIVSVNNFQMGMTNRTCAEQMLPGGKGINVSTVLYNLGIETKALGFSAGFTGKEIERRMAEIGFAHDFISLPDGCSRINVKLKDFDGTEINGVEGVHIVGEAAHQLAVCVCVKIGQHCIRAHDRDLLHGKPCTYSNGNMGQP